jgi:hypothetical protein
MQAVAAGFPAAPKILLPFGGKSFASNELKKKQQSRAEVRIATFLSS